MNSFLKINFAVPKTYVHLCKENMKMTALDVYKKRREDIVKKLRSIELPIDGSATTTCWIVGSALNVTGTTVKNYLQGDVKDGFLAEAIYTEFERLKMTTLKSKITP